MRFIHQALMVHQQDLLLAANDDTAEQEEPPNTNNVLRVLDSGAGTGLLGMMLAYQFNFYCKDTNRS